jgi:hypothetical protein
MLQVLWLSRLCGIRYTMRLFTPTLTNSIPSDGAQTVLLRKIKSTSSLQQFCLTRKELARLWLRTSRLSWPELCHHALGDVCRKGVSVP